MSKKTILIVIALLILISGGFYIYKQRDDSQQPVGDPQKTQAQSDSNWPEIISTNPSPLTDAIILPDQTIELTFNTPLIDQYETRTVIEPKIEYKMEFSSDKKTLKIVPLEPYKGNTGYMLHINSETKFQNGKDFGRRQTYGFRTLDYKGI